MPLGTVGGTNVPPGWTEKFIQAQAGQGFGASSRYGQRPASPDSVAARGTPEWRAAFNAQRDWMGNQIRAGASLHDLGFDPVKEHGLHAYTALREGDFSPFDSNWNRAAKGSSRGVYDSTTGAYRMTQDFNPEYLGNRTPEAWTGSTMKGIPRGAFDPVAPQTPPLGAPVNPANPAPAPNLGSFYNPTPTDTYMTNPRRRTLGSFGGFGG